MHILCLFVGDVPLTWAVVPHYTTKGVSNLTLFWVGRQVLILFPLQFAMKVPILIIAHLANTDWIYMCLFSLLQSLTIFSPLLMLILVLSMNLPCLL